MISIINAQAKRPELIKKIELSMAIDQSKIIENLLTEVFLGFVNYINNQIAISSCQTEINHGYHHNSFIKIQPPNFLHFNNKGKLHLKFGVNYTLKNTRVFLPCHKLFR